MNDFTILLLALKVNLSQHLIHESSVIIRCEYNFFVCPGRLTSRYDVTSDKVNFRPDIRQNFSLRKIRTSSVYS